MKYLEVSVAIKTETSTKRGGTKIKTVKETYLVDALSCTEAEARVTELFTKTGFSQDFEVVGVRESKIIEVVSAEKKPFTSKVTISHKDRVIDKMNEDESKEKTEDDMVD